jgi:hypothetical protein
MPGRRRLPTLLRALLFLAALCLLAACFASNVREAGGAAYASTLATPTPFQDRPDFSGRWTLVGPTDAPTIPPRELVVRETLESGVTVLIVEKHIAGEVRTDRHRIGMIGGTVSGVDIQGRGARTQARRSVLWEDRALVIEDAAYGQSPDADQHAKEVWSLDAAGSLVIVVSRRTGDAAPRVQTLTYRRTRQG